MNAISKMAMINKYADNKTDMLIPYIPEHHFPSRSYLASANRCRFRPENYNMSH